MRVTTVSCSDVVGVPCERSTSIAYSKLMHDDSSMVTWSAAVNLSFTMTPRTCRLVTRSMSGRGGGSASACRRDEKTISFVLLRFSFSLLKAVHVCIWPVSSWHVSVLTPGTFLCHPRIWRSGSARGPDAGRPRWRHRRRVLSPSLEWCWPGWRRLLILVRRISPANSSLPWVPASAGKAKAGMVHSVSGWTRGVRSLENACHTWAPYVHDEALYPRFPLAFHIYL